MKQRLSIVLIVIAVISLGASGQDCFVEIVSPEGGKIYSVDDEILFRTKIGDSIVGLCSDYIYDSDLISSILSMWSDGQWKTVKSISLEREYSIDEVAWSTKLVPSEEGFEPGLYQYFVEIHFQGSTLPNPFCIGNHDNWSTFYLQ